MGPHPFPEMVRDFQAVISAESREQILLREGSLPDAVEGAARVLVGGGDVHTSTILGSVDEGIFRSLGVQVTHEPVGRLLAVMVGLTRLELVTSRLSGVRSNHLSYRPAKKCLAIVQRRIPKTQTEDKEEDADWIFWIYFKTKKILK